MSDIPWNSGDKKRALLLIARLISVANRVVKETGGTGLVIGRAAISMTEMEEVLEDMKRLGLGDD